MITIEDGVINPWNWLVEYAQENPEQIIQPAEVPFALNEEQTLLLNQRNAKITRKLNAKTDMQNILGWTNWTRADAEEWKNTNIGTPLADARTSLAAMQALNLTAFKQAMTVVLNILDKMLAMLWAITQMVIALRDDRYP